MNALINTPRATWTAASASGANIVTDIAALCDGMTDSLARFQYTYTLTPPPALQINLECAVPLAPRIAGIVGGTLPAGATLRFAFRRKGEATYTYQPLTAMVRARPHGGLAAWAILPEGVEACSGLSIQIDNPAAIWTKGQYFEIGEVWMSGAVPFEIAPDWSIDADDNTTRRYTRARQPQPYPGAPRRIVSFTPAMTQRESAFGIDAACAALARGVTSVLCLRAPDAHLDAAASDALTFLGDLTKAPALKHRSGPWFDFSAGQFTETPIPPAPTASPPSTGGGGAGGGSGAGVIL